jgi:hypothetical protein
VDLVIVGCSTADEARFLARMGEEHSPMGEEEQTRLVETVRTYADRLAYYRKII